MGFESDIVAVVHDGVKVQVEVVTDRGAGGDHGRGQSGEQRLVVAA